MRLDFGAYEYIKDNDVYGLVKCVNYTASLTMVVLTLFKQYDIFCEMLEMKCVDISLYLRFSCFNNRITDMSDNAKPGATQCLLTVLNDSVVWCMMKGLCHVFFVMLLCDLIVPDILEYFTNVRYCVWCLPC